MMDTELNLKGAERIFFTVALLFLFILFCFVLWYRRRRDRALREAERNERLQTHRGKRAERKKRREAAVAAAQSEDTDDDETRV